ncbi:MAG: FimB/Mfa2 family fimbrial subunit [Dysgonamonadaceae bacterium]|nr:FimB/Mfa2 family fimbrial subunit [Dysgonamonadaceae bacterium]
MKYINNILSLLAPLWLLALSSCDLGAEDDCCYNVRLEYRYQRYGTLGGNELGYYVSSLKEYVFNERDLLVAVNDYKVPHGGGDFFSEQTLSPGRYTVISTGNKNGYEQTGEEVIGETTKQELQLWLDNPQSAPAAGAFPAPFAQSLMSSIQGRSDRLYYGYRSFTVGEYGVSRIAVDMTHAHCVLDITARWRDNSGRPVMNGDEYYLTLSQVPSHYSLLPEFLVQGGLDRAVFDEGSELYPHNDRRRINYIPSVSRTEQACHAVQGSVSPNGRGNVLRAQFVTFRYRNDSHALLCIYSANDGQVMKEIDLNRFFTEMGISLDYSLCQEYSLLVEIDGDRVTVSLIQVDDWEDGGTL